MSNQHVNYYREQWRYGHFFLFTLVEIYPFSIITETQYSPLFVNAESGFAKPLILPDSSVLGKHDVEAEQRSETRRAGTGGSRALGKHSKRNHTIGFGEHDQIDFVVAESVIRWASCTHIPTAPSLRLSLVC